MPAVISTPATSTPPIAAVHPDPNGDSPAGTQHLAIDHLWLADAISRRYLGRGEEADDLRQVARCGLIEAAARYDPAQGPFVAFAGPTISGVIKRHFRDHGWTVRPPRRTQQLTLRINQQWSAVAQQGRNLPSERDLAASLGESVADIREARSASQGYQCLSLDAESVPEAISGTSDPEFARSEAKMLVAQAWRSLDRAEQNLLYLRFWQDRSQSDIAERIGTSQMQVSRLLARSLAHIRELLDISPTVHAA